MTIALIFNASKLTCTVRAVSPPFGTGLFCPVCSAPHTNGAELEVVKLAPVVNKERDVKMV